MAPATAANPEGALAQANRELSAALAQANGRLANLERFALSMAGQLQMQRGRQNRTTNRMPSRLAPMPLRPI